MNHHFGLQRFGYQSVPEGIVFLRGAVGYMDIRFYFFFLAARPNGKIQMKVPNMPTRMPITAHTIFQPLKLQNIYAGYNYFLVNNIIQPRHCPENSVSPVAVKLLWSYVCLATLWLQFDIYFFPAQRPRHQRQRGKQKGKLQRGKPDGRIRVPRGNAGQHEQPEQQECSA